MAQLEFQDLPISPWLGLDSDELVKTMNQKVRQTTFKERWKYTSAKKAFNLNLEAIERVPDFGGSTQSGVTISDKSNPRILRLTSHKIINEKILMISKAKSPVSIEITESLEQPLEITYPTTCAPLFVFISDGVSCQINEYFEGTKDQHQAIWVELGQNSTLAHTRQSLIEGVSEWKYLHAVQGRDSHYELHSHNVGGSLKRQDFDIRLEGDGANFHLKSASFLSESRHIDQQITLNHLGKNTKSTQVINNVADSKATATCNGRIVIDNGSSKADASLSNKNLALGDNVTFNAKPELEIYNDDVSCSHGATISQLSESELFYLTSRGVHPARAKNMMARGFLNEAISGALQEISTHRLESFFPKI